MQRFYDLRRYCQLYGYSFTKCRRKLRKIRELSPQSGIQLVTRAHHTIVNERGLDSLIRNLQQFSNHHSPDLLYLIQQIGIESATKIGICGNIKRRIKTFLTASPFGIKLIGLFKIPHAYTVEQYLHQRYHNDHLNREWFRLSKTDIDELIAGLHYKYPRIIMQQVWN